MLSTILVMLVIDVFVTLCMLVVRLLVSVLRVVIGLFGCCWRLQ